jgi:hypothetical protein
MRWIAAVLILSAAIFAWPADWLFAAESPDERQSRHALSVRHRSLGAIAPDYRSVISERHTGTNREPTSSAGEVHVLQHRLSVDTESELCRICGRPARRTRLGVWRHEPRHGL